MLALSLKVSDDVASSSESTENRRFRHATVVWHPTPPHPIPGNSREYPHKTYIAWSWSGSYIFAADSMGLSSFKFLWWAQKDILKRSA